MSNLLKPRAITEILEILEKRGGRGKYTKGKCPNCSYVSVFPLDAKLKLWDRACLGCGEKGLKATSFAATRSAWLIVEE